MLNLPPAQYGLIEGRLRSMQSLVMQVTEVLPLFYLFLPGEVQELMQIAFIVSPSRFVLGLRCSLWQLIAV